MNLANDKNPEPSKRKFRNFCITKNDGFVYCNIDPRRRFADPLGIDRIAPPSQSSPDGLSIPGHHYQPSCSASPAFSNVVPSPNTLGPSTSTSSNSGSNFTQTFARDAFSVPTVPTNAFLEPEDDDVVFIMEVPRTLARLNSSDKSSEKLTESVAPLLMFSETSPISGVVAPLSVIKNKRRLVEHGTIESHNGESMPPTPGHKAQKPLDACHADFGAGISSQFSMQQQHQRLIFASSSSSSAHNANESEMPTSRSIDERPRRELSITNPVLAKCPEETENSNQAGHLKQVETKETNGENTSNNDDESKPLELSPYITPEEAAERLRVLGRVKTQEEIWVFAAVISARINHERKVAALKEQGSSDQIVQERPQYFQMTKNHPASKNVEREGFEWISDDDD
ncbi:hypothetical protein Ocin01_09626 [Orchesella cincta]|uniref:Uncharacterized protein n=1 Tax=Orchesella cincta TaxID=48709 RepID=A0A1D2MW69_ORCCI|nr:hypothetical protein Ocin01_09626 [Orchesella cincta]